MPLASCQHHQYVPQCIFWISWHKNHSSSPWFNQVRSSMLVPDFLDTMVERFADLGQNNPAAKVRRAKSSKSQSNSLCTIVPLGVTWRCVYNIMESCAFEVLKKAAKTNARCCCQCDLAYHFGKILMRFQVRPPYSCKMLAYLALLSVCPPASMDQVKLCSSHWFDVNAKNYCYTDYWNLYLPLRSYSYWHKYKYKK